MTILIDNYDSFTYNLVQAIESLGIDVRVFRNDKIDVKGLPQRQDRRQGHRGA